MRWYAQKAVFTVDMIVCYAGQWKIHSLKCARGKPGEQGVNRKEEDNRGKEVSPGTSGGFY